ncbi:MAG: phage tail fiber protein [Alphaproteobacteria bacterium]
MSVSNYLENKLLDKVLKDTAFTSAPVYAALHTAAPGETGANEATGGSYARQQVAGANWNAGSGGLSDNTAAISFAGMPVATIVGVSLWDAVSAGNCLWTGWLSTIVKPFVGNDVTTDFIRSPAHGFANSDRVAFEAEDAGTLPTGLVDTTLYFVVSAATDEFKVSLTDGGGAVDITAQGTGKVRKVTPKTLNSGDTFQINAGDLDVKMF